MMSQFSEENSARYERARSLSNFHLHAIDMQIERIRESLEKIDRRFVLRPFAEVEYLLKRDEEKCEAVFRPIARKIKDSRSGCDSS